MVAYNLEYTTYYLCWIVYIIALIIAIEIFGYFWHRFGAHDDYIPGVHGTHQIHHQEDLEFFHHADEDFYWILFMFIIGELVAGVGVMIGLLPGIFVIISIVISIVVFIWNWWIHRAYHQEDHWLNSYEWFKLEKERHFIHHYQPDKNYGIASHFTDLLMGTWVNP